MATSGRYASSYAEIRDEWTLDELYAAEDWLRALSEAEAKSRENAEAQASRKARM